MPNRAGYPQDVKFDEGEGLETVAGRVDCYCSSVVFVQHGQSPASMMIINALLKRSSSFSRCPPNSISHPVGLLRRHAEPNERRPEAHETDPDFKKKSASQVEKAHKASETNNKDDFHDESICADMFAIPLPRMVIDFLLWAISQSQIGAVLL